MNTKVLEEIGLTKIEAKVYLQLVKTGTSTVWPLIKKTELHKSTVYNVLERLIEKGLVSFVIKGHKRYYQAAELLNLMTKLDEKKEKLNQTKSQLSELIFNLEKIKKIVPQQEVEVLVGKEGVVTAFEKMLKERKTMYSYVSGKFRLISPFYYEQWHKKRVKYGLKVKFIANESTRKKRAAYKEAPLSERRYIPAYHDPYSSVMICGNKVMFTIWSEQPIVIFIHSEHIAKSQLTYFKQAWKTAKK